MSLSLVVVMAIIEVPIVMYCIVFYLTRRRHPLILVLTALLILFSIFVGYQVQHNSSVTTNSTITDIK